MFNYFRPPQLPQTPVGGWFFRELNFNISPTLLSQVYPQKFPKKLAANEKGLWKLGDLKLVCPNVRRYKLLMFNYLQKFNRFPSAETKVQKNYQSSITSVRPNCHKPMLAVGFLSSVLLISFLII